MAMYLYNTHKKNLRRGMRFNEFLLEFNDLHIKPPVEI